jgi:hypothetical protein
LLEFPGNRDGVHDLLFETAPEACWIDQRTSEAFDVTLFIDMTSAARSNPR